MSDNEPGFGRTLGERFVLRRTPTDVYGRWEVVDTEEVTGQNPASYTLALRLTTGEARILSTLLLKAADDVDLNEYMTAEEVSA